MKQIRIQTQEAAGFFDPGTTAGEAVRALLAPEAAGQVLGVMRGGSCVELNQPLSESCVLSPLTA